MIKEKFTIGLNEDAKEIRNEVFTLEQGFDPNIDIDEIDKEAHHVVLYLDGYPIATGRCFKIDPETYGIGRVAVRKQFRGKKIGTYILKFLETRIKSLGGRKALIHSQYDKRGFYYKNGYRYEKDALIFLEEGVEHISMYKILVRKNPRKK